MRQRLAWFSTAPLMLGGLLAGHALGYRLAIADAHVRAGALAHSGHGYFGYVPFALAVCLGVLVTWLVLQGLAGFRGERGRPAISPLLVLLPPIAFVVQEFLEAAHPPRPRAVDAGASNLPSCSDSRSDCRSRWPLSCLRGRWTPPLTQSGANAGPSPARPFLSVFVPPPRPRCRGCALAGLARGYGERAPPFLR